MKKTIFLLLSFIIAITFFGCAKKVPPTETQAVTLYYADNDIMYLHPEKRVVDKREKEELTVLEELFKGPKSSELQLTVNGNPEILSVKTEDGLCTVDLSEAFAKNNTGGSAKELFAIYSIVNSLCELETVDRVKINIEGNEDYPFGGHLSLISPFEPDEDMIYMR